MAFLSRLFKRGDPLAEREGARRQGMRDARRHPMGEFTDPEFQPTYVTEIRARAREQITEVDRRLATVRASLLQRAVRARETILRELGRADLRPDPPANGHLPRPATSTSPGPSPESGATSPGDEPDSPDGEPGGPGDEARVPPPGPGPDAFISIEEARRRRGEARRMAELQQAGDTVHEARACIEQITQEWESALIERNHAVEALHARAEQLIAAYRSGVMRAHPRREEIPSLWKGEVIAMDSTGESTAAVAGREEIGRILHELEARIEVWTAEVMPRALTGDDRPELPQGTGPASPEHRVNDVWGRSGPTGEGEESSRRPETHGSGRVDQRDGGVP
ncbi:hypothetical protein [Nonomuraea sp. NPDC048916]|uniref:hypothetical protein n=1 Tax=Nonomuraea sp. NPDC048916 TaxID=3154232 RepID=UPI0033F9D46D